MCCQKTTKVNSVALSTVFISILASVVGCASAHVSQVKHDPPMNAQMIVSSDLSGEYPDPKRPGKLIMTMTASSLVGTFGNSAGETSGVITELRAILYDKGIKAAVLTAPKARTYDGGHKVVANGGVRVMSVLHPGTYLTADRAVWLFATNKVIAEGHVVYHDGKSGATFRAPSMVCDTKLSQFSGTSRSSLTIPKGF